MGGESGPGSQAACTKEASVRNSNCYAPAHIHVDVDGGPRVAVSVRQAVGRADGQLAVSIPAASGHAAVAVARPSSGRTGPCSCGHKVRKSSQSLICDCFSVSCSHIACSR